ncbi:MAG TPA: PDZ domain-containing protein [Candidatus Limnocylindria bacterium]|nr:PDZ domain-containing protein [Candidatus Limnocylindria bacterium]
MNRRRIVVAVLIIGFIVGFAARPAPRAQTGASSAPQTPASVRFAFGGNAAEIPAEFLSNLIFLPARINNSKPSLFLLDSAATGSSVAPTRISELGLATVENVILSLPGVDFPFAALPALARDGFTSQTGRSYQGTLGNDFLRAVVVNIDYGRKTLQLYDPGVYKYSGGGTSFPITFAGGLPLIRAKLTLPGQRAREGGFIVNTSLDAAIVIFEKFAEGHHLFSAHLKTIPVADPQINDGGNIVVGRPKEFQLGAFSVEGAIAEFSPKDPFPSAGADVAGMIGGGILRRFTVVFDYPHHQLILAPNLRIHELEEEDKSGVTIVAKGPGLKQFEVIAVQPGTPGAHAGIQKGDLIVGIDEEPAADLTLMGIRELFRDTGRTCKLSIERKGQMLSVSISLRRLLSASSGS